MDAQTHVREPRGYITRRWLLVGFVLEQKPSETLSASNLFPYMMNRISLNRVIENICDRLMIVKRRLREAVLQNPAEGLLLSGGLDSSILVVLAPDVRAITVTLETGGRDLDYAGCLISRLGVEHYSKVISVEEAIDSIPVVVKVLESFDPAIPNDLAIYFGLEMAKEKGIKSIMTGDGADELFAGYSFMQEMLARHCYAQALAGPVDMNPVDMKIINGAGGDDLESYIQRITNHMHFGSEDLGKFLGIEIKQPFLDPEFIKFALSIKSDLKVREEGGKTWGKWILRKAFEDLLPEEIVWQAKRTIEHGSGFARLRGIIESKVSHKEFMEIQKDCPIRFISREHLFYYRIYRDVVGEIPAPRQGQKPCSGCGAGMEPTARHCRICGWIENNAYGSMFLIRSPWSVLSV
jgi:asparagine synthase (glutamine-hydrolysing)